MSDLSPSREPAVTYAIVGGGIHGACLGTYLRDAGYSTDDICIIDPHDRLMAAFERKAAQCGMQTLRSSFVHHLDPEPFSLESFVEGSGREDELVPTEAYPERPTLSVFMDHSRQVIADRTLTDSHRQSRVENITQTATGYRLELNDGAILATNVVLALGEGGSPTHPAWTTAVPATAPIDHVWDESFSLSAVAEGDGNVVVVGGGITAAQLCTQLAGQRPVTLLSRHRLRTALSEADPHWINWRHIETELHSLAAGSRSRYQRVQSVRNDGTVPPYLLEELTAAETRGECTLTRGEIAGVTTTLSGLRIHRKNKSPLECDQLILATGTDPVPTNPLVERVASELQLERRYNGYPLLSDRTLAWRRTDSTVSNIYISGALAELTVGPFARNIVGARRVAERLCDPPNGSPATPAEVPKTGSP